MGYPDRFLLLTRADGAVRLGRSHDDLSLAVVLKRAGISLSDNIRRAALFSASISAAVLLGGAVDLVLGPCLAVDFAVVVVVAARMFLQTTFRYS